MPELLGILTRHLEGFMLAFFRIGAMLAWAPVIGHRSIPVMHRAGIAAALALVLAPTLGAPARPGGLDAVGWVIAVAGAAFVGPPSFVALWWWRQRGRGQAHRLRDGASIGVIFIRRRAGGGKRACSIPSRCSCSSRRTASPADPRRRGELRALRPGAALGPAMAGAGVAGASLESGVAHCARRRRARRAQCRSA
jgi:hypothetical protein